MPYPGLNKEQTEKVDRCISKLKGTNKRTGKPYTDSEKTAICISAVKGKLEAEFSFFENEPMVIKDNYANDVAIFRTGFWKGKEFTKEDVKAIVQNTIAAQEMGILDEEIPICKDHPSFLSGGSVDQVVGYMKDPYFDEATGRLRMKEWQIIDANAITKINIGLWRNRSVELYKVNIGEEMELGPFIGACAYVKLPAVGALNYAASFLNEDDVLAETHDQFRDKAKGHLEAPVDVLLKKRKEDKKSLDYERGSKMEHSLKLSGEIINFENEEAMKIVQDIVSELEALKQVQIELELAQREIFIDELFKLGKILPAEMVGQEKDYAKSLSQEQFNVYKALKEKQPVLIQFNSNAGKTSIEDENYKKELDKYNIHKKVISTLEKTRMAKDKIKNTDSYKIVQAFESRYGSEG